MADTDTARWLSGINALLGLWLIVSPFVFGTGTALLWNGVVVGVAVAALAAYNYYAEPAGETNAGAAGLNALLGLWMIASPFVWSAGAWMLWSNVVTGAAVAVLAGYAGYSGGVSAGSGSTASV